MNNTVVRLGTSLIIQINPEEYVDSLGLLDFEKLYGLLGDYDVITANELNPMNQTTYDYLLSGAKDMFFLSYEDIEQLKTTGKVSLQKQGVVEDFVDYSVSDHIDFLKWLNG